MRTTPSKTIFTTPAATPAPAAKTATQAERLEQIERWSHLLDEAFRVPGTNFRVGWDSIIGLVPGLGDLAMASLSAYLIYQARQAGASKWILTRMIGNVGIDFLVGSIPILGDVFDATWKANRRNSRLLMKHLRRSPP
jgi:hypothetical protein